MEPSINGADTPMMTILVVTIALCAIALLYFSVRSRRRHAAGQPVRPLDLQAFRTLMDRDDELFLRTKLPHREFTRLKRLRVSLTWKYVGRIAGNAAAVLHMAEGARQNADSEAAQVAAQVVDIATQIRMQCIVSWAKLAVEFMFPSMQLNPAMLEPKYQALRENLRHLGSLEPQIPLANAI